MKRFQVFQQNAGDFRSYGKSRIATLLAISLFVSGAPVHATPPDPTCEVGLLKRILNKLRPELQAKVTVEAESVQPPRKIQTLDDLMLAFTEGFEPDLNNKEQRNAFEVYRKMRFGDPNTQLPGDATERVASLLSKHPELSKERFRNFKIEAEARSYPVTAALTAYVDPQIKGAAQVRSYLFQVGENRSYWKKIFQYEEPAHLRAAPEGADKAALKQLKIDQTADWEKFLTSKVSSDAKAAIENPTLSAKERAKKLYTIFAEERKSLRAQGKDIKPISLAMVDLIHTIGTHDAVTLKLLKSADGMERLAAFRKILEERDAFAMELGFEKHFDQALSDFGVIQPTGVASSKGQAEKIQAIESEIVAGAQIVKGNSSSRTVRHLSTVESPFRSCLGGSDCSSRTYLTRALDPNYHYFTVTDEQGFSTGHITVVLGEAKADGVKVKVAFVDKIQNVDNVDLPTMTEAVRRSLEEKGYVLALPEEMGGINGISNEDVSRRFIKKNIETNSSQLLTKFKPSSHSYKLDTYASRADDALPMRAVLPLKKLQGIALTPAEVAKAWRTDDFNLNKLVQTSINLKNGDTDDKLRYLSSMKTIEKAGLKGDPEFDATVSKWMADSAQPFKLRKQVLISQWLENKKPLSKQLDAFSGDDQTTLVQNFLDTPRLRKEVLSNKKDIPELLARVRKTPKVREMLVAEYAPKQSGPISRLLDATDLTQEQVARAVARVKSNFDSIDVSELTALLDSIQGSRVEPWFRDALVANYLKNAQSPAVLGRGLSTALNSKSPGLQAFGDALLSRSQKSPELTGTQHASLLRAYQDIRTIRDEGRFKSVGEAASHWMERSTVASEQKAEFLLTQMGGDSGQFEAFLEHIPQSQRQGVWKRIEQQTSLASFRAAAKKLGLKGTTLEKGVIESFAFQSKPFPGSGIKKFIMGEEGSKRDVILTRPFEMQTTPVTQLQWASVMGDNPSRFAGEGVEVTVNGKTIKVDPNRPVEQVSWDDVQEFIRRLNKSAKEAGEPYEYRLPTEAEWEFAARGGTSTQYSFGDDAAELAAHGWSNDNSGGKTQPVAKLKPNAFGLHDMHGNVWEWTQDWYDSSLPGGTDPVGPTSGSDRVIRGGGWYGGAGGLRSARRNYYSPGSRYYVLGFRLVRTGPK